MFRAVTGVLREPIETTTDDGWVLRGELARPSGEPIASAALGHAMMVDRRTMDRRGAGLATTLAEHGIAALNFDLRGHGESGPSAKDGGRWSYDAFVRHDLPAITRAARERFPAVPAVLVGHSLAGHGALISAGVFPDRAPDAVVGLAANLWLPRFEPRRSLKVVKGATLLAWAATTLPRGWFDPRVVRMGTAAEPWPYVWQFARNYVTDRLMSLDGHDDYVAALGRAELPVLAVSSTGDRLLANPASVSAFLANMHRARVTHRIVTDRDISPAPDHMRLVVDARSAPIWVEIADFIRALASGGG